MIPRIVILKMYYVCIVIQQEQGRDQYQPNRPERFPAAHHLQHEHDLSVNTPRRFHRGEKTMSLYTSAQANPISELACCMLYVDWTAQTSWRQICMRAQLIIFAYFIM